MNILILDTETANMVEQPLPYDLGYTIINTETWETLAERSFVIAEIYLDRPLMSSAYYAKKVPIYERDLKAGKRELRRLMTVRKIIHEDMKKYGCKTVAAYNLGFDKNACNNDCRLVTGSKIRWFFPYDVEYIDIWHMACSSFLRSVYFIKWALKNGFVSDAGNIKTSAEVAYRYITKDVDFEEAHTGLEDVKIEAAILRKVLTGRMKFETSVNRLCWRIPQKRRKELGL